MSEINQTSTEASENKSEALETTERSAKGNKGLVIAIVVIVIIAGALFAYNKMFGGGIPSGDPTVTGTTDPEAIVATVNGVKITRAELDEKMQQVRKTIPEGAVDPSEDAAFELQLLKDLVSLKLLVMVAEEKKYTVTEEQIAAERSTLIEQIGGEEMFKQQLQALELSEETLVENMRNELLIRQLLDEETDIETITATDEEIQAAYDSIASGLDPSEVPPLEQVREMVRADVVNQKSAGIIETYLEGLRATAQIEYSL